MTGAELIVLGVQWWGIIGLGVAALFLTFGIGQIDEDARDAISFRPLLIPGILVLWPLVLWRWWVLATGKDKWALRHAPPRQSHGIVAILMAILIPLTLLTSYSIRQTAPTADAPVLLEKGADQ